uniref:MICOS complex subunit MIC10 n=1 Tax=Elaeophora elaphi TaxID=1147741 RepID=A0A0R3RTS6_9BILA
MKKSEDELSETFDRCLADTALKTVSAGTVGLIAAAIFKRQFPLWLSVGMGFGMGIANCRHDMRKSFIHSEQNSEHKSNLKMIEESGNAEIQPHYIQVRLIICIVFDMICFWNLFTSASMDEKRVDCLDLLAFQDMLNKLRQTDDKILFELNTALPSESFCVNVDKGEKCRSIYKKLLTMRIKRMNLIQHCIDENQTNIARLREEKSPVGNIRNVQNTLRMIRSEMDVESIINERSEKAVHDRCRTFL